LIFFTIDEEWNHNVLKDIKLLNFQLL